jgi:23S rRNA pseudouridine1911/1915/1917 synthase
MDELIFAISSEEKDIRIDKFLSKKITDRSRSHIQNLIDNEAVLVNNKIIKSNYKLKENDVIILNIPEPEILSVEPENLDIDIIYEDDDVVVVNKKQGMVVHPAPGNYNGTLVNALLYHCKDLSGINGVIRPGIVHRIDKDTSGILVVAKNDFAHSKLTEQFKVHSIKREYYALTEGVFKSDNGIVDKPIARHPQDRIKMAIVEGGRRAVTHYEVIERFKSNTLVKCSLETGRTHQIRVHMTYLGHPLVGDPVYGFKKQKFKLEGQMLHAKTLGFIHPTKNTYMEFTSELPPYFLEILSKL